MGVYLSGLCDMIIFAKEKVGDMDNLLRRKIDTYLLDWKNNPQRKPLIIKGARQIGKTRSIEFFAKPTTSMLCSSILWNKKSIKVSLMKVLK